MNKKDTIIQAAINVFLENGIEKTKISDITKEAGIAQGTFYLYFPSKLSLMPSIAEKTMIKLMSEIKGNISAQLPFDQQLVQIIDTVFAFVKKHRTIYAYTYTGLSQGDQLNQWETIYLPFYQWVGEFLQKQKDKNVVRPSLPIDAYAKLVINLIESTAEQMYLYDCAQEETIEKQKSALIDFLNHALGVKN